MDTIRWILGIGFLRGGEIALDAGEAINYDSTGFGLNWFAASPFMLMGLLAIYVGRWITGEQEATPERYLYIQRLFAK